MILAAFPTMWIFILHLSLTKVRPRQESIPDRRFTSTIFLKLIGRTKNLGDLVVYTASNLNGDGKTFELQSAYASFLGFHNRIWLRLFADAAALPPTIDFAGPNGQVFIGLPVPYERSFAKTGKPVSALEMPVVDGITNANVI